MSVIQHVTNESSIDELVQKMNEVIDAYNSTITNLESELAVLKSLVETDAMSDLEKLDNKIWAFTSESDFSSNVYITLNNIAMIVNNLEVKVWKVYETTSPEVAGSSNTLPMMNTNYTAVLIHTYENSAGIMDSLTNMLTDDTLEV